jgi:hypothetical protein
MKMIGFVTFITVAMIAGAAEAKKHSGIKSTGGIVDYRAGGNPISTLKSPGRSKGRTVPLRRGVVGPIRF